VFVDFRRRALTLHGQHPPVRTKQRKTPSCQLIERRHGPRRDHVDLSGAALHRRLLGTTANDQRIQPEKLGGFGQEVSAAQQRFDEDDADVRACKCKRDAR
jgi:hypothetical protein